MKNVGFVGWRGMVGSVLLERMCQENDFREITPHFYSTSSVGTPGPVINGMSYFLKDANCIKDLKLMDILITCQGSDYTKAIYPKLKTAGWSGYWLDAASALRMAEESCIILDPVNRMQINQALRNNIKLFIGGNCSITLSLMGLAGLVKANLIEWMSPMTYQSASGAGAQQVRELIQQNVYIVDHFTTEELNTKNSILPLVNKISELMKNFRFPIEVIGTPLAYNLIPWIDTDLGYGNSREEWKGEAETNKILGLEPGTIRVNGLCIRIGVIRSHSAAIVMKLRRDISEIEVEDLLKKAHPWIKYVPNNKEDSIAKLTPAAISGSLEIGVGRFKRLSLDDTPIYSILTVGDQLLWGAAEPLRRMLNILLGRL